MFRLDPDHPQFAELLRQLLIEGTLDQVEIKVHGRWTPFRELQWDDLATLTAHLPRRSTRPVPPADRPDHAAP